jgi:hypothetical protein
MFGDKNKWINLDGGYMRERKKVAELNTKNNKEDKSSRIRKTDIEKPSGSFSDRVMFLQRTLGNQAVQRLIRTQQAKLRIGQPGNEYEREADRVADQVMRMPEQEAASSDIPYIQKISSKCEEETCATCSGEEREYDSTIQKPGCSHQGDMFQSLDEEDVGPDIGDQVNESDQDGEVQAPGDQTAPAACAQPVNWTHTGARDFGPDAIRIDITWDSSTGNLADLGSCTVREVVRYDPIPNPPFIWNPPNPTILTVPGTAGAGMDTHSYPPGLKTGITDPRQEGTATAHQVYQYRCTGAGCSGNWENIPGQAYTITRKVFPEYVRINPWRYRITKTGGAGFSYSREVEVPEP